MNKGTKLVTDWRIRVEIPREFVKVGQGDSRTIVLEEDSEALTADERKLYPGEMKSDIRPVRYYVDQRNYDLIRPETPVVKIAVWSGDAPPWIAVIPLSKLNDF